MSHRGPKLPGLVIERQLGESFRIGNAVVTIIRLGDKRVKFRVRAPRDIEIMRTEIDERMAAP